MALNLRQTITDFLKARPEERFTARELACWIFENMREACEEKRRNSQQDLSDDAALLQQLVAEIGVNRPAIQKRFPQVRTTETRPRRYYWTMASEAAEVAKVEASGPVAKTAETSLSEHALYPLLCRFLHVDQGLYPKRIDQPARPERQQVAVSRPGGDGGHRRRVEPGNSRLCPPGRRPACPAVVI